MFYKLGKILSKTKQYLIFESNYSGYIIYVPEISRFEKNKFQKIFIYHHKNEYVNIYYGFKEFRERIFFEDLLSIQGIGPKTAISILNQGWKSTLNLIVEGNWEALSELPYLGKRSARQIVFEYQDKYLKMSAIKPENKNIIEVKNTLKTLGFKTNQIEIAIKNINQNQNVDAMIEESIRIISNEQREKTKPSIIKA